MTNENTHGVVCPDVTVKISEVWHIGTVGLAYRHCGTALAALPIFR